jgi:hypothetical protein
MAMALNARPEALESFFQQANALAVFARFYGMLKDDVRRTAVKIASRLMINIARQIADTGYRSGKLALKPGATDGSEIELDRSIERWTDAPERGICDSLVSHCRLREKHAFVMMFDHSYSMKGMKIVLAGITAAAIAHHFKRDYAIIGFSNRTTPLKNIDENIGHEEILQRLFALKLDGDTDTRKALEAGMSQMSCYEIKKGLILTDGAWNRGGDPLQIAACFNQLGVIGFPPAKQDKIGNLARMGKGAFAFVENETDIARAIIKCLH